MLTVRLVAVLLTIALLSGASCMPVHSERPLGERRALDRFSSLSILPIAWNGVWCTSAPVGGWLVPHTAPTSETQHLWCWVVSVTDEENGVLTLKRLFDRGEGSKVSTLYVRWPPRGAEGTYLFLSEEDAVLKGSYLWALAHFTTQDQLLVWMTDAKRQVFVELVQTGQLPGRIVEAREGRSGIWGEKLEQAVILGDLKQEHLNLIISRRGELFDLVPWVIERLPPTEPIPIKSDEERDSSDVRRID